MGGAEPPDAGRVPRRAHVSSPPRPAIRAGLRSSYVKTSVVAAVVGVLAIVLAHRLAGSHATILRVAINGTGWTLGLGLELLAAGGVLVILRELRDLQGRPDLFLAANEARSERSILLATWRSPRRWTRVVRRALGHDRLLVGEEVLIRSHDEIANTLDAHGCLDSLPFMPEMAKFCGRRARVFRRVDKVYDYGGKKTLRKIDDVVLLAGLRCDGSEHGGCQASCYVLWKTAWLRPLDRRVPPRPSRSPQAVRRPDKNAPPRAPYMCQFTELVAASMPLAPWDFRQDLRPLLAGNLSLAAFCVAIVTRLFNAAQRARRGLPYPSFGGGPRARLEPRGEHLEPGDRVHVRSREEICATLDPRGRNRGLWFDVDMLKHCGRRYTVLKRVDKIIDDATGRMLHMKTPCIVLDGVDASGEFLRFCAQHEYPFWRERWLSAEPRASLEARV